MIRTSTRRLLATAVAALAAVATAAPPAVAVDVSYSTSSGRFAEVQWLEVGTLPPESGVAGNAHFGSLYVQSLGRDRAAVFGNVADVQCEEGVTPYLPGGHHGEPGSPGDPGGEPGLPGDPGEPPAEGCTLVSMRFMEGADLSFTVDRRFDQATLSGSLSVSDGHGESPDARPRVAISWRGVGAARTQRESGTSVDEFGGRHTFRFIRTTRGAEIAPGSLIGPMVFDDEPGEFSSASIGSHRSMDRYRR